MANIIPYAANQLSNPFVRDQAVSLLGEVLGAGASSAYNRFTKKRRPAKAGRTKKAKMSRVGEPLGRATTKRNDIDVDDTLTTRELRSDPLLDLAGGSNINNRLRDIVQFVGVKICMSFLLNSSANTPLGQHTFINVAVVSPKDQQLAGNDAIPNEKFFRGNGSGRGQDFGTALTAMELRCNPINTDRYVVHKHFKKTLKPFSSTEGSNATLFEFYVPVNRQIRYESSAADPDGANMYVVYWADFQDKPAGSPTITGNINHQMKIIQYFKEPRNM